MIFYDRDTKYIYCICSCTRLDNRRGRMFIFIINKSLAAFIFILCFLFYFGWKKIVVACEMRIECDDDDGGLHIQFDFRFFFIDNILLNFYFMNHT